MRILSTIVVFVFLISQANAEQSAFCGKSSSNVLAQYKQEMIGNWQLEWTQGQLKTAGRTQKMESLPPKMAMTLSFEENTLKLLGQTVKREFILYWGQDDIAKHGIPAAQSTYSELLNAQSIVTASNCSIEQTPNVAGTMVSKRKGSKNYIYLWMFSPNKMLGMSVAHNGSTVASMALTLTKSE